MEKISSKDRIALVALSLFAKRGFDGVSVDQIAEAAGIKGPSLYHHFKNKGDILEYVLHMIDEYYDNNFGSLTDITEFPASVEEFIEQGMRRIGFTIHDEVIRNIRKLTSFEQFRDERFAKMATWHNLTGLQQMHAAIFDEMIKRGILIADDPQMMALQFISPITLLIHLADREPERETECLERIKAHMEHFLKIYTVAGGTYKEKQGGRS